MVRRQLERLVTYPSGHPRNPLTAEQLRAKLARLAAPVVGESAVRALVAEVDAIEDAASVEPLTALLRTRPIREAIGAAASGSAGR